MGHFWAISAGISCGTSRLCQSNNVRWQWTFFQNRYPEYLSWNVNFLHLWLSLAQPISKHCHVLEKLTSCSELSGVVPSLISASSYLDYVTPVKGKLGGFPSPGMQLSVGPRKNLDLLLQRDGSWERNWLPSRKSKMVRDSSQSRVTDGQRQKYFLPCFACQLLHLRP